MIDVVVWRLDGSPSASTLRVIGVAEDDFAMAQRPCPPASGGRGRFLLSAVLLRARFTAHRPG
jgi:hypothetical protein